jgi:hypothetical protein
MNVYIYIYNCLRGAGKRGLARGHIVSEGRAREGLRAGYKFGILPKHLAWVLASVGFGATIFRECPVWLQYFCAQVIEFIERERRLLPQYLHANFNSMYSTNEANNVFPCVEAASVRDFACSSSSSCFPPKQQWPLSLSLAAASYALALISSCPQSGQLQQLAFPCVAASPQILVLLAAAAALALSCSSSCPCACLHQNIEQVSVMGGGDGPRAPERLESNWCTLDAALCSTAAVLRNTFRAASSRTKTGLSYLCNFAMPHFCASILAPHLLFLLLKMIKVNLRVWNRMQ